MKVDFHVHTGYSIDSIIRPRDLSRKAQKLGIIPAVTDHNTMRGVAGMDAAGSRFIPGEEIKTDKGDLIGLYLSEEIPGGTSFSETLDLIHGQGGLSYLPHMYDSTRRGAVPEGDEIKRIDIVEVFNARCLGQHYNEKAKEFADMHGIAGAAGSDTHFLLEFGSTYTKLPDFDISSPKALMNALPKATLVTKKAPYFVRGPTKLLSIGKKIAGAFGF
ncbi:hypothetical protein GF318_04625 [Candidatus Micrarchaeota archaeon]|nr:hypothetical protein [Candidatus Micrarchaeota archaeon]